MNFGEKIITLRKERSLTQQQLADIVGLSTRTIRNYEGEGMYPKDRETYQKLADALSVDINYLLIEDNTYTVYARKNYGRKGMDEALALLSEVRQIFAGDRLHPDDKDELMRSILDAYWIAKDLNREEERNKHKKDKKK